MTQFENSGRERMVHRDSATIIPDLHISDQRIADAFAQGTPIDCIEATIGGIAAFGNIAPAFPEHEIPSDGFPIFTTINQNPYRKDRK